MDTGNGPIILSSDEEGEPISIGGLFKLSTNVKSSRTTSDDLNQVIREAGLDSQVGVHPSLRASSSSTESCDQDSLDDDKIETWDPKKYTSSQSQSPVKNGHRNSYGQKASGNHKPLRVRNSSGDRRLSRLSPVKKPRPRARSPSPPLYEPPIAKPESRSKDDYKVSRIRTAELRDCGPMFLVEWVGWPNEDTWEPFENVADCSSFEDFEDFWPTVTGREAREQFEQLQKFLKDHLDLSRKLDLAVLLKMDQKSKFRNLDMNNLRQEKLKIVSRLKISLYPIIHAENFEKKISKPILVTLAEKFFNLPDLKELFELEQKRERTLKHLETIQNGLNDEIDDQEQLVVITNEVDDRILPEFKFVSNYEIVDNQVYAIGGKDFELKFCNCSGDCLTNCPCLRGHRAPYDPYGNLEFPPQEFCVQELFECDPKLCQCGPGCKLKVSSSPSKLPMSIFRTGDERGWGLRTLTMISPRRFVTMITGELLTIDGILKRDNSQNDFLFLFKHLPISSNLELRDLVIDSKQFGNLSRFINHSCQPNLFIYLIYKSSPIPTLALFTGNYQVKPNEELTLDYKSDLFNRHQVKGRLRYQDIQAEDDLFFFNGLPENNVRKPKDEKPLLSHLTAQEHKVCLCGQQNCRAFFS